MLDRDMLECTLCLRVYFQPVTTSCGHTFCKSCLERNYVYSTKCPLCRTDLPVDPRTQHPTIPLQKLIMRCYPEEYRERCLEHSREMDVLKGQLPVMLAENYLPFPGEELIIVVEELRYRLMVNRLLTERMEKERNFCILPYSSEGHGQYSVYSIGCKVQILNHQQLDDGAYELHLLGLERVELRSRTLVNGYWCAEVKQRNDITPKGEEDILRMGMAVKALTRKYEKLQQSFSLTDLPKCETPSDWAHFVFSLAGSLPLTFDWKLRLMRTDEVSDRIQTLLHILQHNGLPEIC